MQLIPLEDIREARERIAPYAIHTPFIRFDSISDRLGKEIYVKCENLQRTGSFKVRGASNIVLKNMAQAKKTGVVAASAGNHSQGVASICHALGIKATIVMPVFTPLLKVENTKKWGAKVVLHGEVYDESFQHALALSTEQKALFVHPFNDPLVMAGQGTLALELLEEKAFESIEAVVIPVGGGGLISGCLSVFKKLKPDLKIYGVTAHNAPATWKSFTAGKIVECKVSSTLADGVAVKHPNEDILRFLKTHLANLLCLPEEAIAHAISCFAENGKLVAEGAGALPLAAILDEMIPEKKIALVLSGGNVDLSTLGKVLEHGLFAQGRLTRLHITVPDRPGGLSAVTGVLANQGANILQVIHQRATLDICVGEAAVEVSLETRGTEHTKEIMNALAQKGFEVRRSF